LYFNLQDQTTAVEASGRQIRLSSRISGRALSHAHTLTNTAQVYARHHRFDRAIGLATEALDIASQPEYAGQLSTAS